MCVVMYDYREGQHKQRKKASLPLSHILFINIVHFPPLASSSSGSKGLRKFLISVLTPLVRAYLINILKCTRLKIKSQETDVP